MAQGNEGPRATTRPARDVATDVGKPGLFNEWSIRISQGKWNRAAQHVRKAMCSWSYGGQIVGCRGACGGWLKPKAQQMRDCWPEPAVTDDAGGEALVAA